MRRFRHGLQPRRRHGRDHGLSIRGGVQGSLTYSYTDAKFTHWIGSDPLNLIQPGAPQCLPSSPAGECLLNLAGSAFPNIPRHKVSVSLTYTLPLDEKIGTVALTATGSYQTQEWFSVAATRNIQAFGPLIGAQQVEHSQGQAPYGIVNLRAEWRGVYGSPVTVAAFANNLTDYNYAISSISVTSPWGWPSTSTGSRAPSDWNSSTSSDRPRHGAVEPGNRWTAAANLLELFHD